MRNLRLLTVLVLLALAGRTYADNLSVSQITMKPGEVKKITVAMLNPDRMYVAFQLDLQLPDGITIAKNDNNKLLASLDTSRKDDHSFAISELGGNTYRLLAYSMTNSAFLGTSGAIINISILSDPELADGTREAKIKAQVFTDANGNQYNWDDMAFNIEIKTPSNDKLNVSDVSITAGTKKQVSIDLENPDRNYTAFQFDMELPEGLSVTTNNNKLEASLNADRIDDHSFAVTKLSGNVYRFLSYSMSNAEIKGSNGALVNVTISSPEDISDGQYVAKLLSQVFTDASGNQYNLDDVTFNINIVTPVITAENKTREYGLDNPKFTYKSSIEITGTPELTCTATKASSVGNYDIVVNRGTVEGRFSGVKGTLTITSKTVTNPTITLSQTSYIYDGNAKKPTVTVKDGKTTIPAGEYTVGYSNNTNAGTATVTITDKKGGNYNVSGSTTFTIIEPKVKLSKNEATIEKGKTLTLKATVTPSDLTDKSVTWKSSNTAIATVTSAGKVKGVKAGTATITCTSNATGAKATCKVTISYVKLEKTEAFVEKGKTVTLAATVYPSSLTDRTVTWESSNTKVATVTSAGKVKGVKAGKATITCTSKETGLKATCTVTVGYVKLDKAEATLLKGKTVTLTATVYPSSLTDKTVTWKSSNTKIATVSTAGKVKGVKAGTATITCTSKATGLKATCTVTVGYVKLDKTEATLLKGKTVTLTATVYPSSLTDRSVTWKSSNKAVATVTSAGKVKGVKAGTATITCTSKATGLKTTCTVTVVNGKVTLNKTEVRLQKGKTVTLKATVTPSSLTDKSVTWKSSNTKIATVTAEGKVKGIKAGTATITCTSNATGKKATCTVTVLQSMASLPFNGDEILEDQEMDNPGVEEPFDVYDLSGRMVKSQVTSLDGLPRGIYIINGKKVMK